MQRRRAMSGQRHGCRAAGSVRVLSGVSLTLSALASATDRVAAEGGEQPSWSCACRGWEALTGPSHCSLARTRWSTLGNLLSTRWRWQAMVSARSRGLPHRRSWNCWLAAGMRARSLRDAGVEVCQASKGINRAQIKLVKHVTGNAQRDETRRDRLARRWVGG